MGEYITRDTGELESLDSLDSLSGEDVLRSERLILMMTPSELEKKLPPEYLLEVNDGANFTLVLEKRDLYGSWSRYIFELIKGMDFGDEMVTETRIRNLITGGEIDDHIEKMHDEFESTGRCNEGTKAVYHKVKKLRALMRYEKHTGINLNDTARDIENRRAAEIKKRRTAGNSGSGDGQY